jgi:DNA modification methylase
VAGGENGGRSTPSDRLREVLIQADARSLPLVDACVDCVVTSPPYFGLRDYGVGNQIGLERTPVEYVATLVDVFREVRRVLKPEGVCWLNLGDSYAVSRSYQVTPTKWKALDFGKSNATTVPVGMKSKDLMGIPWRVAFALQADGWYLRSDIIWHKPNPMPESVTDRPTKAHEYLFLLTKSERYYYDADAIAESCESSIERRQGFTSRRAVGGMNIAASGNESKPYTEQDWRSDTRNRRSVWTIPTMPYAGAHFATMPEKLVEPCILAGCPMGGRVLDPFSGSGTVLAVAERLGRRGVGVDLNPAYHELAKVRTAQRGLRFGTDEVMCDAG